MDAARYDPALVIAPEERAPTVDVWPAGAWLVTTETAGRWWVWEYGATAPADEVALRLENRRLASGAPEQVAVVRADDGRLRTAGAPLASTCAVAPFLLGWGLIVLAVVLPGLVPVLAAYGAAHGVTSGGHAHPTARAAVRAPGRRSVDRGLGVLVLAGREVALDAAVGAGRGSGRVPTRPAGARASQR